MMSAKRIIFMVLVFLVLSFWLYWFVIRIDKKKAIKIISSKTSASAEALNNFGEGYLIARAKALRSGKDSFELDSNTYNSNTGKKQ